ncbi:hypothetical protein QTG56_07210 [Rossellomorea sp. AcN35-11]|nr:hypothetical protein QTG56_07210 [Rossellomorea sp. AcN35-11]
MFNVLSSKFIAGALSLAMVAPTAYAAATGRYNEGGVGRTGEGSMD